MDQERRPLSVRLVGGFLLFLTAWGLFAIIIVWHGAPVDLLVRWVLLTAVAGAGGWCLLKGILWGYFSGLAVGLYWLYVAARMFLYVANSDITYTIGAIVYLAIGGLVLTGLLMPGARDWFKATWRERRHPTVVG